MPVMRGRSVCSGGRETNTTECSTRHSKRELTVDVMLGLFQTSTVSRKSYRRSLGIMMTASTRTGFATAIREARLRILGARSALLFAAKYCRKAERTFALVTNLRWQRSLQRTLLRIHVPRPAGNQWRFVARRSRQHHSPMHREPPRRIQFLVQWPARDEFAASKGHRLVAAQQLARKARHT